MRDSSIAILLTILLLVTPTLYAEESLSDKAARLYQENQWTAAAEAYQDLVKQDPENMIAWARLANVYLSLQKANEALQALEKASAGSQIPASHIAYHRARAFNMLGKDAEMWQQLTLAVEQGFRNTAGFDEAEDWQKIRDDSRFKQLRKAVDKNAHPCVHDSRYREFDFWLGEWEVYGNSEKSGALFGNNKIELAQDNCLLVENWTGASGITGTSMNYFDGIEGKWVQHWVSVGGTTANMQGGLENGSMKMQGKIFYLNAPPPQVRDFRAVWTPHKEGYVRQFFEESVDGGETWYTWFEGFYFPKPEKVKE